MDEKVAAALVVALYCAEEEPKQKKQRSVWVRPMFTKRDEQGHSNNLLRELRSEDPDNYRNYLRMDAETFQDILQQISPIIGKKNTYFREAISCETRLAITLRFLATGDSYREFVVKWDAEESLQYAFRVSACAISSIVTEVCRAIYSVFQSQYMKTPTTEEDWLEGFENQWNFINCIGALDGKHVKVKAPPNSGSHYFNYKGEFSFVLMALVDADLRFLFVDVGSNGRASDGGVWAKCNLRQRLEARQLSVPNSTTVASRTLPYVIVADEAFPLKKYLMKPFSRKDLNPASRIFNYRLSRARRVVENAFGVLAAVFRVFRKPMEISVDNAKYVTLACCVLHNIIRSKNMANKDLIDSGLIDIENINTGDVAPGLWRRETNSLEELNRVGSNTYSDEAKAIRENFKDYFMHEGAVDWQARYA